MPFIGTGVRERFAVVGVVSFVSVVCISISVRPWFVGRGESEAFAGAVPRRRRAPRAAMAGEIAPLAPRGTGEISSRDEIS
jgi:hypothetical protein